MEDLSFIKSGGFPPRVPADPFPIYTKQLLYIGYPKCYNALMRTAAVATAMQLLRHFKVIALKACGPDSTPRSITQMLHLWF